MEQLWEDWVNLVLGLAVLFVPALPAVSATGALAWNAYITGGLIVVVAAIGLTNPQAWEEWLNLILGGWLVAVPFVYGIASGNAGAALITLGVIIALVALWALVELQQQKPSTA